MTTKHAYIEKMELQLGKLNSKMEELETKAQEAKEEARSNYKEEMTKLRHQAKLAIGKLEELKTAGDDSWETMVEEMEKMHEAYTQSTQSFFSLFKIPTLSWPQPEDKTAQKEKSHHKKV